MRAIEAPPGSPAGPPGRTFSPGARVGWAAFTSGYTGLAAGGQDAGASAPPGLAEQARWAYRRAIAVIEHAGLGLADALAMTEYLSPAALPAAAALDKVRPLGVQPAGPPTSSVVVRSLVRPEALFEVRLVARAEADSGPAAGLVYLPGCRPEAGLNPQGQAQSLLAAAATRLRGAGLSPASVCQATFYLGPGCAGQGESIVRLAEDWWGDGSPACLLLGVPGLLAPGLQLQADLIASREPVRRLRPEAGLTAAGAGGVLFASVQAGADRPDQAAEAAYARLADRLRSAGFAMTDLVETREHLTPALLPGYRAVASVRRRLLREPFPAATGLVCDTVGEGASFAVEALVMREPA